MIANLPLLFTGGNPTSLMKMLTHELEGFITFLVHCSWGHDTAKHIQQPQWWPPDVPFSDPFLPPKARPGDWTTKLRNLIKQCYIYHSSEFLLNFSEELAKNHPSTLQYVDNCDRTTSLYQRSSGRLLVTFRNENMLYDRKNDGACRKSLLPKRQNNSESMVEQVIADIYLCDTCDEVFENLEDVKKHEIECSQRPTTPIMSVLTPEPAQKQELEQDEFMNILGLQTTVSATPMQVSTSTPEQRQEQCTHRQRRSTIFSNLANFPFSSLAGRRMNSRTRNNDTENRQRDHLERYCSAPPLCLENPKWLNKKRSHLTFPTKYKKTENYWSRNHVFPCQKNKLVLDLKSQLLLLDCKPLSVEVKTMSEREIKEYLDNLQTLKASRPVVQNCHELVICDYDHEIEFVSVSFCDPLDASTKSLRKPECVGVQRSASRNPLPNKDISIIDIIDLCSDDEEVVVSENTIPFPVACHASAETVPRRVSVASTPEYKCSAKPNSNLEAAHFSSSVKRKSQLTNSEVNSEYEQKYNKPFPLKEFHVNLYSSNKSNIISID